MSSGYSCSHWKIRWVSPPQPATTPMSPTTRGEPSAPMDSQPSRPSTSAAKPRGKRTPVAPIDPAEFTGLTVTSVRDDLVRAVLAGPRASEPCVKLNISIAGVPGGPPTTTFTGPVYYLSRVGDASHALEIYRRLDRAYIAKKRPKALADLVAEIAEEQAEDRRYIWLGRYRRRCPLVPTDDVHLFRTMTSGGVRGPVGCIL
jgi:hypothetical protein